MDPRYLQQFLQVGRALDDGMVRVRFVVGALGHLLVQAIHLLLHPLQLDECEGCLLPHRAAVVERHLLREVTHGRLLGCRHVPARWGLQPRHDLQEGRFSRPVLAREGYPLIPVQHERDVVEQGEAAKPYREVFYRNHSEFFFTVPINSWSEQLFCSPVSMFLRPMVPSCISFSPTSATKGIWLLSA